MNSDRDAILLVLSVAAQWFAILLFAEAVLHKLRDFPDFLGIISGYRLMPFPLLKPVSVLIVIAELIAILSMLIAIPFFKSLASIMLLVYAMAMTVNIARGRHEIDCGCGGASMPVNPALVYRNIFLAAAIGWAVTESHPGSLFIQLELFHLSTTLALTACLVILYMSFNQLCSNLGFHRRMLERSST